MFAVEAIEHVKARSVGDRDEEIVGPRSQAGVIRVADLGDPEGPPVDRVDGVQDALVGLDEERRVMKNPIGIPLNRVMQRDVGHLSAGRIELDLVEPGTGQSVRGGRRFGD